MTTIASLQVENYRRLSAVEIRPDGSVVEIAGRNGAGKTSVLNAVATALGGKDLAPREPIKKGKDRASITVKLTNGATVTRRFWRGKDGGVMSDLKVEIDKAERRQPQAYLSDMVGDLAFNPLEFATRLKPAEQFDVIAGMIRGLDLAEHARLQKADFDERTVQNRIARDAKAAAEAIKLPPGKLPPLVDIDQAMIRLSKAHQHNSEVEHRRARREATEGEVSRLDDEIEKLEGQLARLQRQRSDLRQRIDGAEALPAYIDTSPIEAEIMVARGNQGLHTLAKQQAEHQTRFEDAHDSSIALTRLMEQREVEKNAAIAAAKLPVPDLGLGDGIVTLGGLPLDQASGAEQLRVSVAIGMARNPKLRVMLVDEGSSLDEASLAALAAAADDRDYQIWVVRVAEGEGGSGFLIEDGRIGA